MLDAPAVRRRSDDDDGDVCVVDGDERQGEKRTLQMGVRGDDSSCSPDGWIRWRVR